MNDRQLSWLAQISACNAMIAAMTSENSLRASHGDSPAYGHGHFLEQQQELYQIHCEIESLIRQGGS